MLALLRDSDSRKIALCVNLFISTQHVQTVTPQNQFCGAPEKKCRGTQCRRTNVRQGSEFPTDKKKNAICVLFGALISGRSTRAIKKDRFCVLFGASAWYAAPHFSYAIRDSDPREVAKMANLFALSSVQFGRSVVAHSAAAQSCGWGQSPL